MLESILIAAIFLILGIPPAYFISKYFHNKSTKRQLTAKVDLNAGVLSGIEPAIRERLRVQYDNTEIPDLYQFEFSVANTGDRAIMSLIEPLKLALPSENRVFDYSIIRTKPSGRKVDLSLDGPCTLNISLKLLNKGESFSCRVLTDRLFDTSNLVLGVVGEDLPPQIVFEDITVQATASEPEKASPMTMLGFGLASLATAALLAFGAYILFQAAAEDRVVALLNASTSSLPIERWALIATGIAAGVATFVILILGIAGVAVGVLAIRDQLREDAFTKS